jgi:hypothetical protein
VISFDEAELTKAQLYKSPRLGKYTSRLRQALYPLGLKAYCERFKNPKVDTIWIMEVADQIAPFINSIVIWTNTRDSVFLGSQGNEGKLNVFEPYWNHKTISYSLFDNRCRLAMERFKKSELYDRPTTAGGVNSFLSMITKRHYKCFYFIGDEIDYPLDPYTKLE